MRVDALLISNAPSDLFRNTMSDVGTDSTTSSIRRNAPLNIAARSALRTSSASLRVDVKPKIRKFKNRLSLRHHEQIENISA